MGDDRLDGWKEISKYIKRDIRTSQRWEKEFDLPIYRIDNQSDRPKVYSYKSELDEWFKSKHKSNYEKVAKKRRRINLITSLVLFITAILIILFVYQNFLRKNMSLTFNDVRNANPVRWDLRGTNLVFFDDKDNYLWSKGLNNPKDLTEYYRDEQDEIAKNWMPSDFKRSRIDFSDIDKDGKNEVLTVLMHENPLDRCIALCDNDGRILWSKSIEFNQEYEEGRIFNDYKIQKLSFDEINQDGAEEILALWTHARLSPSVFFIYDKEGKEILKYSHTGLLDFFSVVEFAGFKKILLGGTNNLLAGDAVLILLDCSQLKSGLAPPYDIPYDLIEEKDRIQEYVPKNPKPAFQNYYIRFKKNEISRAVGINYLHVHEARASDNAVFVMVNLGLKKISPVYFHFNPDFSIRYIRPGLEFKRDYKDLLSDGTIQTPLKAFLKRCEHDVFFWDGKGNWIQKPTALKLSVKE